MNTVKNAAPLILRQRLAETLAIALAYFSTATLGFVVAVPPGNVTPVWPPSGLALAAVIGYRSGVGIWLGSFGANVGLLPTASPFPRLPNAWWGQPTPIV